MGKFLSERCRSAGNQMKRPDDNLAFFQKGACGNHGSCQNPTIIQQQRPHIDQTVIFNMTTMHHDIVSYGDMLSDMRGLAAIRMHRAVVLNIGAFTDKNRGHISSDHRTVPDADPIPDFNVPDNHRSGRNKYIPSDAGFFSPKSIIITRPLMIFFYEYSFVNGHDSILPAGSK